MPRRDILSKVWLRFKFFEKNIDSYALFFYILGLADCKKARVCAACGSTNPAAESQKVFFFNAKAAKMADHSGEKL